MDFFWLVTKICIFPFYIVGKGVDIVEEGINDYHERQMAKMQLDKTQQEKMQLEKMLLELLKSIKTDYENDLTSDLQNLEYKEMLEKADSVVLGIAAAAGATGAIPVPFADAPLLIGEQVGMMVAINSIFEFNVSKDSLKSLATATIGIGGATVIGKTIAANLLKLIPGAGSIAGGAISAATACFITLALGKAYIEVCKAIKMGKLDQDDLTQKAGIDALKAAFEEQLKNSGKSLA